MWALVLAGGITLMSSLSASAEEWIGFKAPTVGTMTGPRFIDIDSIQSTGSVVRFRRRYVVSSGRGGFVSVSELDCITGMSRAVSIQFIKADGIPEGAAVKYGGDDAAFKHTPNDLVQPVLIELMCTGGAVRNRDAIRRGLEATWSR
jgi:hypothetical protein